MSEGGWERAGLTEREGRELMALSRWSIRRWETHSEYDDLLAEVYQEVWYQLVYAAGRGWPVSPSTVAVREARRRAQRYGQSLTHTRSQRKGQAALLPRPEPPLSLDRMEADASCVRSPSWPDFAPGLVDRLLGRQLWRQAKETCTPAQWAALAAIIGKGLTVMDASRQLGVTHGTVRVNLQRAIARLRATKEGSVW